MNQFIRNAELTVPLFTLVALGFALARWTSWPPGTWKGLNQFVFSAALPALLFRQMTDLPRLPPTGLTVLAAFFGGCLLVFALGRVVSWRCFGLDGAEQSIAALGGVLSNNVLLGIPLATAALGPGALPTVALVLVFNALVLWTLATISVEWARKRAVSPAGLRAVAASVLKNPVVAAIIAGTALGLLQVRPPDPIDRPLGMLATAAAPLALIALGAGLVGYSVRTAWRISATICAIKLVAQPLVVWGLAVLLGLPPLQTQVVTLLASLSVGANVYLMASRFGVLEGPVAASLVLSTGLSAVTTPLTLTLLGA